MIYLFPLLLSLALADPQKQGFSGFLGQFDCTDMQAVGLADGWWYTWTPNPSQYNKCKGLHIGGEFAPMINGVNAAKTPISDAIKRRWVSSGAKYLLGYNEPDPGNHPHQVDPKVGAQYWPNVQKVAADTNLTLVSPAISTTGCDSSGKCDWLDVFFDECEKLSTCDASLIKHVALHDYTGNVREVIGKMEGAAKRYNRTIWLTEVAINKWACNCEPTRAMQNQFMTELFPALDASDAVDRYAWFTSRAGGFYANLIETNSSKPVLTSTGQIFKKFAEQGARRTREI